MSVELIADHQDELFDETELIEQVSSPIDEQYDNQADKSHTYLDGIGKIDLLSVEEEVELAKRIEAGVYAGRLLQVATENGERLPVGRRRELTTAMRDGARAKNHMIEANLRLVVFWAKRYQNCGLDFEDLIQEGNMGLIHAVEKFDYTQGIKFVTYATWWIRRDILSSIGQQTQLVRKPRRVVAEINKVKHYQREIESEGGEVTYKEIAKRASMDVKDVEKYLEHGKSIMSLDRYVGEDEDAAFGDFMIDTDVVPFENIAEYHTVWDDLYAWMEKNLTEQEYDIIQSRFELNGRTFESYDTIRTRYKRSREYIWSTEASAKEKIRKRIGSSLRDLIAD